jgi:threonine dehydratase
MSPLGRISIEDIRAARERIAGSALRTPLVRLEPSSAELSADFPGEIWLKLECLQPIGSFKIRGASNAMRLASPEQLKKGVVTASAGNMAQGVAWNARRMGVPCTVIVPEGAPKTKLHAIERLGAQAVPVPRDRWWQAMVEHGHPDVPGFFVHPFADSAVMAGNGTIGLEILEDLPDADAVLVPWGGGGLSSGIASALLGSGSAAKVFACEVDTAAPLAPSLEAGHPVEADYTPSFVDGIGGRTVFDEMWLLASTLIAGSIVVSISAVAAAVRLLAKRARVVAEGAGATPVAAALSDRAPQGKLVCVVSGGNIDAEKLARILIGSAP